MISNTVPIRFNITRTIAMALLLALTACATPQRQTPAPHYKVGKPYQVNGHWYYPEEDPDYERTGIASWYGREFHGRRTANGEIYDMTRLSAAHTTLPLPSMVEVKNLENGRKLVVRVNDRGPFARGRLIDLSREAARRLGFEQQGTARVRVRYLGPARLAEKASKSKQPKWVSAAPRAAGKPADVASAETADDISALFALAEVSGTPPSEPSEEATILALAAEAEIESPPLTAAGESAVLAPEAEGPLLIAAADIAAPEPSAARIIDITKVPKTALEGLYVIRVVTLSRPDNIERLRAELASVGPLRVSRIEAEAGSAFYRVNMGPFDSAEIAAERLEAVRAAGYDDALMVTLTP